MLLEPILSQPFREEAWSTLIQDIFPQGSSPLDQSPTKLDIDPLPKEVRSVHQIETLSLGNENLALLIIGTGEHIHLARNRVALRNFVSKLIILGQTDAVLAELTSSERIADARSRSRFSIALAETEESQTKADQPIRDFARKLLGRLNFLQKKGWLGVVADCIRPANQEPGWSTGDRHFLQTYFNLAETNSHTESFHSANLAPSSSKPSTPTALILNSKSKIHSISSLMPRTSLMPRRNSASSGRRNSANSRKPRAPTSPPSSARKSAPPTSPLSEIPSPGLNALQHQPERPFFLWHLLFRDVFQNGGSDIVIANPSYVRQELIKDQKPLIQAEGYTTYTGTADLLV